MRFLYKVLPVFLCVWSLAVSSAESREPELSVKMQGDWTLASIKNGLGETSCLIGVASPKAELRVRLVSPTRLVFDIRIQNLTLDEGKYLVWLKVDDNSPVKFEQAIMDNDRLLIDMRMTEENVALLRQSIDGLRLELLSNLLSPVASFSLKGSGKAIAFLRECERK